ncbi:MAG TPA: hypothetical protein VM889_13580 [Candidatus Thermoplasmatota archaeon]|nr:hypothetical protein [Candidatus Thermoplasmatota archaeon]
MSAHNRRHVAVLALACILAAPLAIGEREAPIVDDIVVARDALAPLELTQTQCGGTAPLVKQCTTVFYARYHLVIEINGCYTGDIHIQLRDTKITAYPKSNRDWHIGVVCGVIVDAYATGTLYANRETGATATTSSLFGLVKAGSQDPGVGPWTVRYTF